MARKKNRRYTQDQKTHAVQLYQQLGVMRLVAEQLGVSESNINRWVRAAERKNGGPLPRIQPEHLTAPSEETEAEELRRLRREVARLREERDFLKKATAFFAREDQRSSD